MLGLAALRGQHLKLQTTVPFRAQLDALVAFVLGLHKALQGLPGSQNQLCYSKWTA